MSRLKRLLSLDGGGIRGVIAAEVLSKIEQILQDHNPRWQCLADYFDFIGGTSTGSILAAGLAKGMKVKELFNSTWNEALASLSGVSSVRSRSWVALVPNMLQSRWNRNCKKSLWTPNHSPCD